MQKLYADYFDFHFTNQLTPKGRNGCYICYEVRGTYHLIPKGVFENQFYPKKRVHAEVCFLNWFKESILEKTQDPGEGYDITWYMSWSPCVECATQVAEFLTSHRHVKLRVTFPRLYHCNKPEYQQGLRNLARAGAELTVMTPEDFKQCWRTFVDPQEPPFPPSCDLGDLVPHCGLTRSELCKNSEKLSKMLTDILQDSGKLKMNSTSLNSQSLLEIEE